MHIMYQVSQCGIAQSLLFVPYEIPPAFLKMPMSPQSQKQNTLCPALLAASNSVFKRSSNSEGSLASIGYLTGLYCDKAFPGAQLRPLFLQFKAILSYPFPSTHSILCLSLQVFNIHLLCCFCIWLRYLLTVQHFVSSVISIKYFVFLLFVFC